MASPDAEKVEQVRNAYRMAKAQEEDLYKEWLSLKKKLDKAQRNTERQKGRLNEAFRAFKEGEPVETAMRNFDQRNP